MNTFLRRTLTAVLVIAMVIVGSLSIEAAAAWARASQPAAAPAVSVDSLQAQLDAEHARSAGLQGQLERLTTQSATLREGMVAADARIAADLDEATLLRDQLTQAKKQLTTLKRQLAAAAAAAASQRRVSRSRPATTSSSASGGEHEEDDD